jgi:hypothetical protein
MREFTDAELDAYLDEALSADDMADVERKLREDPVFGERLATTISRRDAGVHSLGAIWRRHRISCPTREQLGGYLLGTVDAGGREYIDFHMDTVGCRFCRANIEDLRQRQADTTESAKRKRRYFDSSAGFLGQGET